MRRPPIVPLLLAIGAASAEDWPGFRGPRHDGTSHETSLPLRWSATENIAWRAGLPGVGHSSPVVWGNRVFLTAFVEDTSVIGKIVRTGRAGELIVLCLDRDSGRRVWQRTVRPGSIEGSNNGNSPATPTPATDGERVYAYFGSYGVLAVNAATGEHVWEARIGPFPHHMGTASSPVLAPNGMLVLNVESDGPDFLLALDRRTGRELWRTPRRQKQAGYATAAIWNDRAILAGHRTVKAYQLATGARLWEIEGLSDYAVPTPVVAAGFAIVTSSGPGGSALVALRADGSTAWSMDRAAAYVASPTVAGNLLFTVKDSGVMSAVETATGRLVWQQRLPQPGRYFASPVAADGRVYVTNEHGTTIVVAAARRFEVLAVNHTGLESTWASLAVSAGRVFLRAPRELLAIGAQP